MNNHDQFLKPIKKMAIRGRIFVDFLTTKARLDFKMLFTPPFHCELLLRSNQFFAILFTVLCYFLAMTIWGGEFEYGVKSVSPISDILRPTGPGLPNWNDLVQASLGYSYWYDNQIMHIKTVLSSFCK